MSPYSTKWILSLRFVFEELLEARNNSVLINSALFGRQVIANTTMKMRLSSLPNQIALAERTKGYKTISFHSV